MGSNRIVFETKGFRTAFINVVFILQTSATKSNITDVMICYCEDIQVSMKTTEDETGEDGRARGNGKHLFRNKQSR